MDSDRESMLTPFDVPLFLATQVCADINGYVGCKSSYDTDDQPEKLSLCFDSLQQYLAN